MLLFLFGASNNAHALIIVTNTNDNGAGSLRDAVAAAIPGETIQFNPGLAGQTIVLTTGQIVPTVDMIIDGQNQNISISGNNASRVFYANGGFTLTLRSLTIRDCNNGSGAALFAEGGASLSVDYVNFKDNQSGNDGGAVRTQGGSHDFTNCSFTGNQCTFWGGAYYLLTGSVVFENCEFTGNRANNNAGAVFVRGTAQFLNCTFSGNYAGNATGGGALHLWNGANVSIGNSIFWNNQAAGNLGTIEAFYTMDAGAPGSFGVEYSIVQGSGGSGSWNGAFGNDFGANLDVDPIFVNPQAPTAAPTSAGSYELDFTSPAQNSGNNPLSSLPTDLAAHPRIVYGVVDRGCYELCKTESNIAPVVCDTYNSPAGNVYTTSAIYNDTLSNFYGCDSVIIINLTVNQTAVVNAGVDQSVCANNPAVNLAGTVANATGGDWTGGAGGYSPNNSTLNAIYTPSGPEITAGTVTLTLTSTGNGVCSAISDDMTITITPAPTADAGVDIDICEESPTAALGGTVTVASGGSWTSSGSGGFAPSSTVLNPVYTASGPDIIAGTVTLTLMTTGNGNCLAVSDDLILTINPTPTVSAGADQTVCDGTAVTLTGTGTATGYAWDNSVIDGTPFTPSVGSLTYTVTGTDANGCMATDQADVTVNANPTVTFGAIANMCENDGVYVMTEGAPSGAGGVYSGPGVTDPNFDPSAAGPGVHTITYTYTDGNTCSDFATQNITVMAQPAVVASGTATICIGASTTVSAAGAVSYNWDNSLGAGASHLVSPTVTTTYTVTGTGANGCVNTDAVTVTVNPLPIVSMSPPPDQCLVGGTYTLIEGSPAGGTYSGTGVAGGVFDPSVSGVGTFVITYTYVDGNGCTNNANANIEVHANPVVTANSTATTVCDGQTVTLTGGGALTYVWNNGASDGVPIAPPVGLTSYLVTGTDANGCDGNDLINIIVNALPTVNAGVDQTHCEGTTTVLNGAGAVSYTWDNGVTDGVNFIPPVGLTTYTVTGTDGNGCQNTDDMDMNINALPAVTFAALTPLCMDGPPYTFVEGSPAGGTYSGPGVSGGSITQALAGLGIHTIYYSFTDGNGCTNIDSSDIEIYNSPTITATATGTSLCDGDVLTLNGAGAVSYNWNNGVTDGVTFTPAVGSYNYQVTGFDINGCSGVDSVMVTVHALPVVSAGADQSECEGTATTLAGTGASTYTWDNGVTDGVPFTQAPGNVTYTVVGTDANGCQNTDDVIVFINPIPVMTVSPDQSFCQGDLVTLTASGANTYLWDGGAGIGGTYAISPTGDTSVDLVGTSAFGCTSNVTIDLTYDDPAFVDAGVDQVICQGFTANLSASGGVDYYWNGPGFVNENMQDIAFSVDTSAYYYATITTADGCIYTDSLFISISNDPNCTIATVTSVTPNNDGVNDVWNIQGIESFPDNHVTIYNRWGDEVFDAMGYDNDLIIWDGTSNGNDLGAGTYFYVIELTNGPTTSGWIQLMK